MSTRTKGAYLNTIWKVGAAHALYIHDGHWYHPLKRFPGALFDRNGYIIFQTENEYLTSPFISIGKQIHVPKPGISGVPGYVRVQKSDAQLLPSAEPEHDVDIHITSSVEGRRRLVLHLERERNRAIILNKKSRAKSISCEICNFSFEREFGTAAKEYCEVHHILPLSEVENSTITRMEDLAILCANCHRVIHLHYPPYTLDQVRQMRRQ